MNDRWVCRTCFASNDDGATHCSECAAPRGAVGSMTAMAGAANGGGKRWWQHLPMRLAGVAVVIGVSAFGAWNAADRDETGEIDRGGTLHITDLRVGDCFDWSAAEEVDEDGAEVDVIDAIPCDEAHQFEVFYAGNLEPGTFPSRSALDAETERRCLPEFETYVGREFETSTLDAMSFEPTEAGWNDGDRGLLCVVSNIDVSERLTGSVRGSAR